MNRLRDQSGVAMMMALVTMFILAIVAGEIAYQSGVYSSIVFRQRDQLEATLLARSGLRLALLQLRATKKARAKAKALGLGENSPIVDKIWQTPLVLPPPDIPGLAQSDKEALRSFKTSLGLGGTVGVTILGENGRMSINQLVWPPVENKNADASNTPKCNDPVDNHLRDCTPQELQQLALVQGGAKPGAQTESAAEQKKTAMKKAHDDLVETFNNMLEKKRLDDDGFREKYASVTGEILVGNLLAWMDPNTQMDGNQRDKNDYYSRLDPPYAPKNAPIASESEFHMIEGLDETLAKLVADNFTVQATNSLDVNKASLLLIKANIPDLSPDALERIGKRRSDEQLGGPFKDENDFWTFVNTLGNYQDAQKKLKDKGVKILSPDATYHVVVTAHVDGTNTNKTWLADVGPLPPKDPQQQATPPGVAPTPQPAQPAPQPQDKDKDGKTTTPATSDDDYDSLSVVYLKAD